MPGILAALGAPKRIINVGRSGAGKTGAIAALVCLGYKPRIADGDRCVDVLAGLLTNPAYPYADWIKAHGIDLNEAVQFEALDDPMELITVKKVTGGEDGERRQVKSVEILGPKSVYSWEKLINLMVKWPTGGSITDWGPEYIFVPDSLTTIAWGSYYHLQDLNNRRGALDEGYDYQRDIGGAQGQIRRLFDALTGSRVTCNILINAHPKKVDLSAGYAQSPSERARKGQSLNPETYPNVIGQALSPEVAIRFNNMFITDWEGTGAAVRRYITTVPSFGGLGAKTGNHLAQRYCIETGLAEIMCALRGEPAPEEFIAYMKSRGAYTAPREMPTYSETTDEEEKKGQQTTTNRGGGLRPPPV